jgi:hypothetical protein
MLSLRLLVRLRYDKVYGSNELESLPTPIGNRISHLLLMQVVTFPHTLRYTHETPFRQIDIDYIPTIFTTSFGLLFCPVGTFSILRSVNMPSMTLPKTTCFPSKKSHFAVVMKNCEE